MWRGCRTAPTGGDAIYKDDSLRLLSFATWPNVNVSKESLALAGFYYIGAVRGEGGDTVRCAWCGVELDNWLIGDCPISEHLRHFPACDRAKEMATRNNIPLSQDCNDLLLREGDASELGISSHRPPAQPKYSTFATRLDTFAQWPESHCQRPHHLASAGFYFTGPNDQVRCYYCDMGLCRWEPTDDPWVEHAKHFPDCYFLLLVKGRGFIERCRLTQESANVAVPSPEVVRITRPITDADVEHQMNSEDVQVALHCGLQPERIRSALRRRLQQTGLPFRNSTQLIDAALNVQVNETPFSVPESRPLFNLASSSSTRYSIDDAAIDQVTRMIINSALMEENSPAASLMPVLNADDSSVSSEDARDEGTTEIAEPVLQDETTMSPEEKASIEKIRELMKEEANKSIPADISLEEENKLLRDARTCKICMDSEVGVVFLPCGHLVSCIVCATGLSQCPICRAGIKGVVRTYLS